MGDPNRLITFAFRLVRAFRMLSSFQDKLNKNYSQGNYISICIILLVAFIVYYFSAFNVWIDDDLTYQYQCADFERWVYTPFNNVWEIFASQYSHYFTTNGRYVAHWIVQLFTGLLGMQAFAICNAIIYILFIRIIMRICGVALDNWKGTLTIACLILTFLSVRMTPSFQMYIWMFLLVLVYLRIFLHYRTDKWWLLILICVFSAICGNAHESINPGICLGLTVYIVCNLKRITAQQWLMALFFAIGLGILVFSPSTQDRMTDTCPWILEWRVLSLYAFFKSTHALTIMLCVLFYKCVIKKESFRNIVRNDYIWWAIWFGCLLSNLYWGFSGGRSSLGEELFAIILTIKMLRHKSFTPVWLILLVGLTIYFLGEQYVKLQRLKDWMGKIEKLARTEHNGFIYMDFQYTPTFIGSEDYTGTIDCLYDKNLPYVERYMDIFSRHFTQKWQIDKQFRIYPTALRPYIENTIDTTEKLRGNRLINYSQDAHLMIKNKKHPGEFYIKRTRDLMFFHKEYPREQYFYGDIIYEDSIWIVSAVKNHDYNSAYSATYYMEGPKE